jgi:heat-inducible transcriptional repressor
LGIFVSREGFVHNRVIEVGGDYSYPDLEKISNYCNKAYYGCSLEDAISKATSEFEEEQTRYDKMISRALLWSKELLNDASQNELLVQGESKFIGVPEFNNTEKLKHVMEALEEKKGILNLLNSAMNSNEICVFIGAEAGVDAVSDCSIVTTAYKKGGKIVGTLGVIGPTRMDYSRVIPTVDFTARLVSDILGR